MRIFSSKINTISDKDYRSFQRRAAKTAQASILDARAVAKRKASDLQRKNAKNN